MNADLKLWQWRYTDQFGKRRVFPCRLTEQDALHLHKLRDAERIEGTLEVRQPLGLTSDFQRAPSR